MLVDCDIHNQPAKPEDIVPYMPPAWRSRGVRLPARAEYPHPMGALRKDADPPDGSPPGSSPDFLLQQLVEPFGITHAILTGELSSMGILPDGDYATILSRAYNDWVAADWLDRDPRFLGSIRVAPQRPRAAAEEIRRWADDPRMIQIYMVTTTELPLGHEFFHPIWEAACDTGRPVALHPGWDGMGLGRSVTPHGFPGSYLEWHALWGVSLLTQVASLTCEGTFHRFPDLRIVCLEGGLSWIPHLMWRLDKDWRGLRAWHPHLSQPPSRIILDHCRFSTQPIDEPEDPKHLHTILDIIEADRTVLFATDYPHWDFDNPDACFPPGLSAERKERIRWGNAAELYGLETPVAP